MVIPAVSSSLAAPESFSLSAPTNADSMSSFAQQLAAKLESFFGTDGNLSMNIQAGSSQGSGGRQFLVTVSPQTSETSAAGGSSVSDTGAARSATGPSASTPAPPTNEADAYWAQQPPEVQALRDVANEGARAALAQSLANEGYKIDVPIMVWKWDPLVTMTIRQNSGYTWVPSGNQQSVPTCPNCSVPGLPSYDPANPPAGSIAVSTDFAKGLESTAPWTMS